MIAFMRLLVAMLASLCAQVAPAVRGAATPPTAKHLVLLLWCVLSGPTATWPQMPERIDVAT